MREWDFVNEHVDSLRPEQEERVLTTQLVPTSQYIRADGCRCLVGVTMNYQVIEGVRKCEDGLEAEDMAALDAALSYDFLCEVDGREVVNEAIRNRILSNQARRTLQQEPAYAMVLR